jgi:hypothetical protein
VKLQMQQQEADVGQQAEVEEVLAADGKPVSRASIDRVVSRCALASAGWCCLHVQAAGALCNSSVAGCGMHDAASSSCMPRSDMAELAMCCAFAFWFMALACMLQGVAVLML